LFCLGLGIFEQPLNQAQGEGGGGEGAELIAIALCLGAEVVEAEFELVFFGGDFAPFGKEAVFGLAQVVFCPFEFGTESGFLLEGGVFFGLEGFEAGFEGFEVLELLGSSDFFLFAALEHFQVGGKAIGEFESEERSHGLDHRSGEVVLFSEVFDLFAIKQEEVGNTEGEKAFDALVPGVGPVVAGGAVEVDLEGVFAAFEGGGPGAAEAKFGELAV